MANYPRKDKRGLMRLIPSIKQVLTLAFVGFGLAVIALAISVRMISVPEASQIATAQTTILYYDDGLTISEIGEALGVTESRVSQIHTKAVLQLRSRLAAAGMG
jgi:membrane protein insertase Oxa1/YidC/SpoIIIJ